jgi:ribonuclease PH
VVVDMAYADDKEADMDLNLVMTENGRIVELQATAEGDPVDVVTLKALVSKGGATIKQIIRKQKSVLNRLHIRS